MGWGALLPMMLFVAVVLRVAFGLLHLARRTGELPEALLGGGLVTIAAIGLPLCGSGRSPALFGSTLGDVLFVCGAAGLAAGTILFFAFNWVVFHQRRGPATAVFALGALASVSCSAGLCGSGWGGTDLAETLARTRPWALGVVAVLGAGFAWSCARSFVHWRRQRRQRAIGLGDPVVENRFALWAAAGGIVATLCVVMLILLGAGVVIVRDPRALSLMALAGSLGSVTWLLTFLPPARYLRWVRSR